MPNLIHMSCPTLLKNKSRTKHKSIDKREVVSVKRIKRSEVNLSNFKEQCFYCEQPQNVKTLEVCKSRNDSLAKSIERGLLNISDFVASKANYCKKMSFEL